MQSERTIDRIDAGAVDELQQAARDTAAVSISEADDGVVTLQGEQAAFEQVQRSLWIRELSAREHGQDALAAADRTARVSLSRAGPTSQSGTRTASLSD